MHHKIIKASDITAKIMKLVEDPNTIDKISLLNLEDVKIYIKAVKIMLADLKNTISTGLKKLDLLKGFSGPGDYGYSNQRAIIINTQYGGYNFNSIMGNRSTFTLDIEITPSPYDFNAKLQAILIELEQQKIHLDKINKLKDKVTTLAIKNLLGNSVSHDFENSAAKDLEDKEEKKDNLDTIKALKVAETQVAFEALEAHAVLYEQFKVTSERLHRLETESSHTVTELKTSLSNCKKLKSTVATLSAENKKMHETALRTQKESAEQKAELLRLKPQAPLSTDLERKKLISLLNNFSKAGLGIFSRPSDETYKNLKKLSETKTEKISNFQIKNCIKDPLFLQIFDHPTDYNDSSALSRTGMIIRELAFSLRQPIDLSLAARH